jgi:hypothetical protein
MAASVAVGARDEENRGERKSRKNAVNGVVHESLD